MDIPVSQPASSQTTRHRYWLPILILIGAGLAMVVAQQSPHPDGWGDDYTQARNEAERTHQPLLVAFHMQGCTWCDAMVTNVLNTGEVRSALTHYVPVKLDLERQRELANRLNVYGAPTYAILDASGQLIEKCEGYQPLNVFVEFLHRHSHAIGR